MSVPKLRFKEFDGDWSNKKIGNIASKVGSGSTPRGGAEAYTDHGIIFIRSQNVNNDQLLLDDVAYIPEETHVKMSGSKVIANDILLNITGASIGRSCVVPHDFTEANVNQHVCIIRTPNDDPIFVQSFLSSENGQNAIQSKQAGGGREGLNFQAIRSIDFHFPPSKEEQTKIASFLSAVDEKISQLNKKHELLSQYKQGMMQKLFSQQIRFKADDGSEFGEWEDKKIGDIFKVTSGSTPLRSDERYFKNAEIFWVKTTDLNNGLITKTEEKISKVALEETSIKVLPKGTVFVAMYGGFNQIGRTGLLTMESACNQALSAIYPNQLVNPYFLLTYLNFKVEDWKIFAASSRKDPNITKSDVLAFPFILMSLEEQTKIAHFLSAIDQKIEVVAQKIKQAKMWKKGLLQQMFV